LPAAADLKPDTLAAFYYQNVREYDLPAKDFVVALGQEERFNVGQFDVSVPPRQLPRAVSPPRERPYDNEAVRR